MSESNSRSMAQNAGGAVSPAVRTIRTATGEFQALHALLTNRKKRHQRREFLVQGVRPIDQALALGWTLKAAIYRADRRLSRWAKLVMAAAPSCLELTPELFARISEKDEPGELVALLAMPERKLDDIAAARDTLLVVLDRPTSPGNLGTIIRSSDALGASAVVVTGHATDPYDPQAIRASTGSLFAVPVVIVPAFDAIAAWVEHARSAGVELQVIGTDERGTAIREVGLERPLVLVFGNEAGGLSAAARGLCDEVVSIAMRGAASSLNVASAAAVVLYEVERRAHPAADSRPT